MKKIYFLLATVLTAGLSYGQDFTATYDFASVTTTSGLTDPTPPPTADGATFGSFSVVNPNLLPSVNGSSGAGRFSFPNQPLGATHGDNTYANLTGSLNPGVYYTVTITPNANTALNLTQITFRGQRSGTGVRTYAVRSSVDNYAANLPASIAANDNVQVEAGNIFFWLQDAFTQGVNGHTITLGSAFSNLTSPVTFRFYGWNAEGDGGNFSIDDVVFTGSTSSLGVKQNSIAGLKVYPNPVSNGTLYIDTDNGATKEVAIFDVIGKQVLKASTEQTVNVSSLKTGVYMVKITEEGKTATRKLVIK